MSLMLVMTNTFLSISTKSMTHPISFMSIILAQTLFLCLASSLSISTPWFAFVLFLIFLGGVMVLFIYMSSLASNENFLLNFKDFLITSFLTITIFCAFYLNTTIPHISLNNKPLNLLSTIYSIKFSVFFLGLILYLLFTLLVVSGIIKVNKSPMRSIN